MQLFGLNFQVERCIDQLQRPKYINIIMSGDNVATRFGSPALQAGADQPVIRGEKSLCDFVVDRSSAPE